MKSSGLLTDTTKTVHTGPCRLLGVSFAATAVAKNLTITVYDALTNTAGKEIAFGRTCGGTTEANKEGGATNFVIKFSRDDNMFCTTGIYVVLSAASEGSYIIYYEPM